ncbi:MAG: DUF4065 domain-containing protein [Planctomycetales bacterium]|nr:DUF4065 domain-containing protein [Planctomycetales bacterium]
MKAFSSVNQPIGLTKLSRHDSRDRYPAWRRIGRGSTRARTIRGCGLAKNPDIQYNLSTPATTVNTGRIAILLVIDWTSLIWPLGGLSMISAFDVAKYILERKGPMTHMKLQKLVYYSQAWSLVWDECQLFENRIEAWANGPVIPDLYAALRQKFLVAGSDLPKGSSRRLSVRQQETVDAVLAYYGDKPSQWLSDLTHMEAPWLCARQGLPARARSSQEITLADMAEYYGSL